jgi:hypothetical protein
VWGSALFQTVHHIPPSVLWSLPIMPEWYMVLACLAALTAVGALWTPLLIPAAVALGLGILISLTQAAASSGRRLMGPQTQRRGSRVGLWGLTTMLHMMQPLARLSGRIRHGLTPWRRRGGSGITFPWLRRFGIWSETWKAPEERLRELEIRLRTDRGVVRRGGEFDRWDLELRGGMLGAVRIELVVEEHGSGHQLVRVRAFPRCTGITLVLTSLLMAVSVIDAMATSWQAALICDLPALMLLLRSMHECGAAMAAVNRALEENEDQQARLAKKIKRVKRKVLAVSHACTVERAPAEAVWVRPEFDEADVSLDSEGVY